MIVKVAEDPNPKLRYQTSKWSEDLVRRKYTEAGATGQCIIDFNNELYK